MLGGGHFDAYVNDFEGAAIPRARLVCDAFEELGGAPKNK